MNEQFTAAELKNARRAILSLRNKSAKALDKLKEGTWQNKLMRSVAAACDVALHLTDGSKEPVSPEALDEAHTALEDALRRAADVIGKFAAGSSQHTLQKNRIAALRIALALIERERANVG
jgi:hypothetical protein